jgi:dephospho-CoA kinase
MKIALSGKLLSGKTTIAEYLRDYYGYEIFSFATPIVELENIARYDCFRIREGELEKYLYGLDNSVYSAIHLAFDIARNANLLEFIGSYIKCRGFRQRLGEEIVKDVPDFFINRLLEVTTNKDDIVIDDLRLASELTALRYHFWKIVRCECDETLRLTRVLHRYPNTTIAQLYHYSETMLDSYISFFDAAVHTDQPIGLSIRQLKEQL